MPLNWVVSIFVVLCGFCLTASICIYISAQELFSRTIDILNVVHDWIEQSNKKEAEQ